MRIGFTGTRRGMTESQKQTFARLVRELKADRFDHGSCQGADVEAARIFDEIGMPAGGLFFNIACHPGPDGDPFRELSGVDTITFPGKTHFARNRDIVDATGRLVACPCDMSEQPRGGTWYTVVYARKQRKPITIIWPDGTTTEEQPS